MNKQSRQNRKIALKNYNKGNNSTSFEICKTVPGTKLSSRTHTIEIGYVKNKRTKAKVGGKNKSFVNPTEEAQELEIGGKVVKIQE